MSAGARLEVSGEQLATQILGAESGIASDRIRRGDVALDDFTRLVMVGERLAELQLYVDDASGLSAAALRTRAPRLKRRHGLGLVVVDYLQR